jgi:hypothetical protein
MQLNFDASGIEPNQSATVTLFPLGDYPCEITGVESKQVKDKQNAGYLEITWTVFDGQFKGCSCPQRLNLWNDSQDAVRIAYGSLSAICHSIGRLQIADSQQLVGGRALVTLGPQANNPEKYSEVKHVRHLDGREPGQAQAAALAPAPSPAFPPAPTAGAAPWGGAAPAQPAPAPAASGAPWGGSGGAAAPALSAAPWSGGASGTSNAPPWAK